MMLATFIGVSTVFGAISYFEVRPGPAKPSPVGTTITIFQGTSKTIRVNGHGTDFAKSVAVSGRNVSARITGRKNGLQHKHYKTNLPLGEVSLRVTARPNARLGTRTVTIRYPVGQDRFKIRIKKKPAPGSADIGVRRLSWPKRNGLNKLAAPFKSPHLFMQPIGVDHKSPEGSLDVDCENYRKRPFPYCYKGHVGTDYLLPYGYLRMQLDQSIDVVAAAPGEIVKIAEGNFDRCIGDPTRSTKINCGRQDNKLPANYVIIKQDGDNKYASYQHLQNGSVPTSLKEGDRVKCGQKLGRVGSSGRSAYPHLHFQLSNYQSLGSTSIDPYKEGLWLSLNLKNVPNGKCPLQ
jgi:murein DD-endopeptidase MepM/ murein hydrolase activator NlpD